MKKVTPYLANGYPRTCWSCGQPFAIRFGRAHATVGSDNQLYCSRVSCEETALLSHVCGLQRARVTHRAA